MTGAHLHDEDREVLAFLNDWPDGTPKSFGNDFTARWDGRPSCMAPKSTDQEATGKVKKAGRKRKSCN